MLLPRNRSMKLLATLQRPIQNVMWRELLYIVRVGARIADASFIGAHTNSTDVKRDDSAIVGMTASKGCLCAVAVRVNR